MFLPAISPSISPEVTHPASGLPSGSGAGVSLVGRETASAGVEWSLDWEEQDRIQAARFRAGICEGCSHFIHAPSKCDTKPIRFGLLREDKCACPVGT